MREIHVSDLNSASFKDFSLRMCALVVQKNTINA